MNDRIHVNDVLQGVSCPRFGIKRVLWINRDADLAVAIEVPTGAAASKWYRKGPKPLQLSVLETELNATRLAKITLQLEPITLLSDDQLRARFPCPNGEDAPAPVRVRDQAWHWISPLFDAYSPREIFEGDSRARWIHRRAKELGIRENRIYCALHRFWAGGAHRNALLPNTANCGRRKDGKARVYTTKKPGRPNKLVLEGRSDRAGYILTEKDKQALQAGYRAYVKPHSTVHEAYLNTCGVWWSNGTRIVDGRVQPELLPPHERPTEPQFRRWGPKGDDADLAWRARLAPGDYERTKRGYIGSSRDKIVAVGQVGFADATPSDQHLVSMVDRLKLVGRLQRLPIVDGFSDVIAGGYVGYEAPSGRVAMLAVYSAASSKASLLERLGIDYKPEEWPEIWFKKILGDSGELRTKLAQGTLGRLGCSLEYIKRGRADRNRAESKHNRTNKRLDHRNDGSTNGRRKKKGEPDPRLAASWTYWEYLRQEMRAVHYHNNKLDASHLLTTEMKRDKVAPNRMAIFRWSVDQGYVATTPPDPELLHVMLLPEYDAVVRENGIYLLRPDRGNKREYIPSIRYVSHYLIECDWLERARCQGVFPLTLHLDPNSPRYAWFADDKGLHKVENAVANSDPILRLEATLPDLLYMHDLELFGRLEAREESDQAELDYLWGRETTNEEARQAKADAKANAGRKVTKTELTSNVEANRKADIEHLVRDGSKRQTAAPEEAPMPRKTSKVPMQSSSDRSLFREALHGVNSKKEAS